MKNKKINFNSQNFQTLSYIRQMKYQNIKQKLVSKNNNLPYLKICQKNQDHKTNLQKLNDFDDYQLKEKKLNKYCNDFFFN